MEVPFELYPLVAFACNEEDGMTTGRIQAVQVDGLISIAGEGDYAEDDRVFRVRVAGAWFPVRSNFRPWIGNMAWNGAYMRPRDFAALLNHLKRWKWAVDEAVPELWDAWESPEPISEELLTRLILELAEAKKARAQ